MMRIEGCGEEGRDLNKDVFMNMECLASRLNTDVDGNDVLIEVSIEKMNEILANLNYCSKGWSCN